MDLRQQRIADDLAGAFEGDLRFDAVTRALYSTDASLYQVTPLGVACPRHVDDVALLARYAEEARIPLVPRGAGTGLAGGALGDGLIVDFSRYLTAIESIDEETVRVQPGVIRDTLNRALKPLGRYFPPDPSNTAVTTIGGMLGVDAAGSHAVRVGSTRDHVLSLNVVLIGGHRCTFQDEPVPAGPIAAEGKSVDQQYGARIAARVAHLLRVHRDLIHQKQPPLIRNCAGYHVRTVVNDQMLHLPRLLVGSEGTLAMTTAATLHTAPLPLHRGVALLLFGRMDSALSVVQALIEQQPSACDLLDRRLLSLGRESDPRFEACIPLTAEAGLIVEQTGYTEAQARQRIKMAFDTARGIDSAARLAAEAFDDHDVEFLWSLPHKVVPNLLRLVGESRAQPFVEDIAVPPAALQETLRRVQQVLQKHEVTASLYAHAASGQIHLRPFLPFPRPADGPRIEALARELYEIVIQVGGTISGEHGDGLSRTAFLRTQYGPLYRVFREVKQIFDPLQLLNPDKIVSDDPHLTVKWFRGLPRDHSPGEATEGPVAAVAADTPPAVAEPAAAQIVPLQLTWSHSELSGEALRCNGCGVCRTVEDGLRMCPLFRAAPSEEASPRAKANAIRTHLAGGLDAAEMSGDDMKRLANLCFNCKQCKLECPSSVDIPHMMIEAKAQYVAMHGLRKTDWILSRAHSFGSWGCWATPISNWLLNNRAARWSLERLMGVAAARKLPRFANRPFLDSLRKPAPGRPGSLPKGPLPREAAIYFVDYFANFHDPSLAWAFLAVLEHLEIPVHVPLEQTASGLAMISAGDLGAARTLALENIRTLGPFAREGHPIVCTEPAAVIALKHEYPRLIDHPDVEVIARQTWEAGSFLKERLSQLNRTLSPAPLPMRAAYHTPCHSRVLSSTSPWLEHLARIPGLELQPLELGCSGMAGAFGLTSENFDASLAIGRRLIDRMAQPDLQLGVTECSSCKLQMEQGTTSPTLHPLKLLALTCGLSPETRLRLNPNTRRYLVS